MNRLILIPILGMLSNLLLAQINWTQHTIDPNFSRARSVYAIDLDGDNDIDVLGAAYETNDICWWENDADQHFTKHTITDDFYLASCVYAIDLDTDGDMDVLGAGWGGKITWWENDGDENFTEHTLIDDYGASRYVFAIDLDGDDDIDILSAGWGVCDNIIWWENDGNENFTQYTIDDNFLGAYDLQAIDLDNDGDLDVLGVSDIVDDFVWWENDGNENFTKNTIDDNFNDPHAVHAVDLDDDNDLDILVAYMAQGIIWWANDGNENFTPDTIAPSLSGPSSVYATDMDRDGDIDIVASVFYSDDIIWWENDGEENFTQYSIDDNFDGAYAIYVIDLDDDGDEDVLGVGELANDIAWWESDVAIIDVSTISIDIPSTIPENTTLNPQATVKNLGIDPATFQVTCKIDPDAYTSLDSVYNLASGDSIQVTFPESFNFVSGFYTVTVYTELVDDQNLVNDTLEKVIEATGIAEENLDTPIEFMFEASTINNNRVEITFTLPEPTRVDIMVYDIAGRLCQTLISKKFSAGTHRLNTDLGLSSGVYFYNLRTESGKDVVRKFLFIQ